MDFLRHEELAHIDPVAPNQTGDEIAHKVPVLTSVYHYLIYYLLSIFNWFVLMHVKTQPNYLLFNIYFVISSTLTLKVLQNQK